MNWRNRAACKGAGDVFLLPMTHGKLVINRKAAAAQAICRECPVLLECRSWLAEFWAENGSDPTPWHVVAGMTPDERLAQKWSTHRPGRCGSMHGYWDHQQRKELPCGPCREAIAEYQRDRRERMKQQQEGAA